MPTKTEVKVSGVWKTVHEIWVRVAGSWKKVQIAYNRQSGTWEEVHRTFEVPTGLIIPYNGVSAPSGWTLFTDADGKYIIGAGDTYNPSDEGAGTGNATFNGSTAGSHTGTAFNAQGTISGATVTYEGGAAAGGHAVTAQVTSPEAPYEQLRLIKASAGNLNFPQNGVVLGVQSFTGLTNSFDNDRFFRAGATIASGAGDASQAVSTTGSGSHLHGTLQQGQHDSDGSTYFRAVAAIADTGHSVTLALTYKLQALYMSLWTDAAADFAGQLNMIAMYENLTPPTGWVLCDGNNGTPDLRNYFVIAGDTGNHGTNNGFTGYNLNANGVSGSEGSHGHAGSSDGNRSASSTYHTTGGGAHQHSFDEDQSWLPPYFSLAFIQYQGQ